MNPKIITVAAAMLAIPTATLLAQTATVLHVFTGEPADGNSPRAPLIQGPDGTLYGTTYSGGANLYGTVFKVNPDGSGYAVLLNLAGGPDDGAGPRAGLMLSGSALYGTTQSGGTDGGGTVFKVNTDETGFVVLKNFSVPLTDTNDGAAPTASLLLSGSTLYGTTSTGGSNDVGTVFSINTNGTGYLVLKNFGGNDGEYPSAGLVLSEGTLYGTTQSGGSNSQGTVFMVGTNGSGFTSLKSFSFNGLDPAAPAAGLQLSGSTLYGISSGGGLAGQGTVFEIDTNGSGFAVLKSFPEFPGDGSQPAGLQLSGSVLYGTTQAGGANGNGAVFRINTDGTGYALLDSFDAFTSGTTNSSGAKPSAGVVLSGTTLYGTASSGGSSGIGAIFSLPYPFVSLSNIVENVDGSVTINFLVGTNYTYILQAATNLTELAWQSISTNIAASSLWQFTTADANNYPARFFRVTGP